MPSASPAGATQLQIVMAYAAELELEVDRLRRRDQFLQHEAHDYLKKTVLLCKAGGEPAGTANALADIAESCQDFTELLRDVREAAGYHPAFDQVFAIAVRPLT